MAAVLSSRSLSRVWSDVTTLPAQSAAYPGATLGSNACPSCGGDKPRIFHQIAGVPVNSCQLVGSRHDALAYPLREIELAFCRLCGFIWNTRFDQAAVAYSSSYEETQGYSPRFQRFMLELAVTLIERHGLRRQDVLEIGCGKGEFLALLCRLGRNRGVGLDPSFVKGRLDQDGLDMRVITDFYDERYLHLAADLICCRHTLEHIPDVGAFMRMVRQTSDNRPGCVLFFEVPDVARVLKEVAFWDIYYEHCSYFSLGSLARLFERSGFQVLEARLGFDSQYLLLDAAPTSGRYDGARPSTEPVKSVQEPIDSIARLVDEFSGRYRAKVNELRGELDDLVSAGRRVVLWGSGSKAVAYLTTLRVRDEIEQVVDINPHKHGKYLAGTGHRIVGPEDLQLSPPDHVIVVNPIYRDEIVSELAGLGIHASVSSL